MTGRERELTNRDVIVAELAVLRAHVCGQDPIAARHALSSARAEHEGPSTLDEIARGFGLTEFERSVLLLAAGTELVGAVGHELMEHTGSPRLTFSSALALLPDAHWSALAPPAPLRRWNLLALTDPASVSASPLVVDERVLHHLAGAGHLEEGLAALSQRVSAPLWLPKTLSRLVDDVVMAWSRSRPVLLHGPQPGNVRAVAAGAAGQTGLHLREIGAVDLPTDVSPLATTLRLMERETTLLGCAWAIDMTDWSRNESTLGHALVTFDAPLVLMSSHGGHVNLPDAVTVAVPRLSVAERREAIGSALRRQGVTADPKEIDSASGIFDLAIENIEAMAGDIKDGAGMWEACRARQAKGIGPLALVTQPSATWDDLVLPVPQTQQLKALVAAVRHRARVLDEWGFAARMSRGLGTAALFAGPSGTGKTLAAEVIAHDLALDLVHVDLSQVVSKYIGETEKHLRRLFDAAEDGGVVLLFDEADTLFGKRSEVRDSHDRYANLEVGYLLQRVESFSGLAILTTNARAALDQAFTRRLSTVVTFPYPDQAAREAMWEHIFPVESPLEELAPGRWATADLAGGGIAAAALQASYLAAADGGTITFEHIQTATRWELAKSGRSATTSGQRKPR